MSRTIKDMPYEVRVCERLNKKCPKDFRESEYIFGPNCMVIDRWTLDADIPQHMMDRIWRTIGFSDPIIGKCAKDANKNYKAKCRQAMRNGDYDSLPRWRRTARWDAY
jgi:hypothetical protein